MTANATSGTSTVPASFIDRLDALLAAGDPEGVIDAIMRDVVHMSEDDLAVYRALPAWQHRLAAAHTTTREARTEPQTRLDRQAAAQITVPVLMVMGQDSPDAMKRDSDDVAAALPDARITVIEGQQAHRRRPGPGSIRRSHDLFLVRGSQIAGINQPGPVKV